jgi:hypothetical protein
MEEPTAGYSINSPIAALLVLNAKLADLSLELLRG